MKKNKKENIKAGDVKKIKISEIIIKPELMPRMLNMEWVNQLRTNLEKLEPISINQENKLIKGRHRLEANKLGGKEEIDCVIEITKDDWDLYLKATEDNAHNGLPYTFKERKMNGKRMFKHDMESKEISKKLGVSVDTVNKWVKDIRQGRDEQNEEEIIQTFLDAKLTQSDVAKKLSIVDSKVSELKSKISSEIKLVIAKKELAPGELKEKYEDIYKFAPFTSDIWEVFKVSQFDETDTYIDKKALTKNLLFYNTQPFDTIYVNDKEVIEVCKTWLRRYFSDTKITVKPKFVILDGGDKELSNIVEQLKPRMKEGHIAVKACDIEQDNSVINIMGKFSLKLANRIILPYARQPEGTTLQQGYESLLIFNVR